MDIAYVKLRENGLRESVCTAEIFPQMGRNFRCRTGSWTADVWLKTDTQSDVSVAVSQERHDFVTHFATDQWPASAENLAKSQLLKHGGGGLDNQRRGRLPNRI